MSTDATSKETEGSFMFVRVEMKSSVAAFKANVICDGT